MYDLIVLGAGPAGITASVYAARKRMNLVVITKDIGGQAAWSGDIENYTGYQFITGPELAAKFESHMKAYGITVKDSETALDLEKRDNIVRLKTDKDTYTAKTIIIASGKRSRELGVPGEKEYKNKGITYCATCDGPLFADKAVAIIGGGNSALDAAIQLSKIANKISIINNLEALGGDPIMKEKVLNDPKVTVYNNSRVDEVNGEKMVKGLVLSTGKTTETLPVEGIFVEIGLRPNSEFAKNIEKNGRGEIKIDSYNGTNIPGIFAAGDVTNVPEKQIVIAAGEGAKAALGAFRYLARQKVGED